MNKQQLAAKIWESANKMRSKIEANDYKDYILGFVFYKFLSEKMQAFWHSQEMPLEAMPEELQETNADIVKHTQQNLGYFISYKNLFSTWIEDGSNFSVENVRDALNAFSRLISPNTNHKKVYDRIFNTLQTGLSKLGDSAKSQTVAISDLIHLIDDIPMNSRQDYDVLGFIYEYLISMFAANAGKKAGEFYTPHEVSLLMSEIIADHLKDREEIKIYDPTSGSGSLLINIGHSVTKHLKDKESIKYYAQELKENTYNLTRMNLIMRGISVDNIVVRNADTLEDDWPYFDDADPQGTYEPLYVDAVVSNPPYSQNWNPDEKESDVRYAEFGLAPKSKADFAFLLHDLYHLKPNGIMAIVLPHGVLFRGGEEEKIRTNLLEKNHIDAIIGLPANIFFGTGIPTIIMILCQQRKARDVLFVDASKQFIKAGKQNKLQQAHIRKIVDCVVERREVDKFSRLVPMDEIRNQGYNLNIPRYVDSSEAVETFDIFATMHGGIPQTEIDDLQSYWTAFPTLREDLFQQIGNTPYYQLKGDTAEIIAHHMAAFEDQVKNAFGDFDAFLDRTLVQAKTSLPINHTETQLSRDIFNRLKGIPLIDPYVAYQDFAEQWVVISSDLEVIQSEGERAITAVDPNRVIKKKDKQDEETQEGYLGRILPFDLVQREKLTEKLTALQAKEARLGQILAELASLAESLSEEEKLSDAINDDGEFSNLTDVDNALTEEIEMRYGKLAKNGFEQALSMVSFQAVSLSDTLRQAYFLLAEESRLKSEKKKTNTENTVRIQTIENRLAEIATMLIDLTKTLTDADKELDITNAKGTAFKQAGIKKVLQERLEADYGTLAKKALDQALPMVNFEEESFAEKLKTVHFLLVEEKQLKADIKADSVALHLETKSTIEALSLAEADDLLHKKWISPLVATMQAQPQAVKKQLNFAIRHLSEKYATPLTQISHQLNQAEQDFAQLLGTLQGSDYDLAGIKALQELLK